MTPIRILIVDDVPQVRQDLRTLLNLTVGIEIVGEAADGLAAIDLAIALRPDAILMDIEMPILDGFEAARRIKERCPMCRVIALTVHDYETAHQRAKEVGVDAFVVKGAPVEDILKAITRE
jgi:DNA-binding NarL/FixJ family response regulator